MNFRRRFLVWILIVIAVAGGAYFYNQKYVPAKEFSDTNVLFVMEAYDKIQKNYWNKPDQYDLPKIFDLSFEKALGQATLVAPTDRATTALVVEEALKLATSTEGRRNLALQAVAIALYNLEPIGRNGLLSNKQEREFRDVVANKNPVTGKVEATVKEQLIGKTLYLDIKQIAPTTLQEIGEILEKASTTPGVNSLLIDLRGNIGGALGFLNAFLGLFIGQDQYAFDLFSQGNKKVERTTLAKYPLFEQYEEIAFLSDNKTQSTAELTIDAFKRYRLGKSVGITTKGWGTIENTYPIETKIDPEMDYMLLLVHSLTVRQDNQPIEGLGVAPDVDTSQPNWQSALPKQFNSASLINAIKEIYKSDSR